MQDEQTNRVELHDLAAQLGLTPDQVRDELAGGRLAFDIDEAGVVYTDKFAAMDWIQRRVAALAMFGQNGLGFPLYAADWQDREHIPGPTVKGFAGDAASAKESLKRMQEAENE